MVVNYAAHRPPSPFLGTNLIYLVARCLHQYRDAAPCRLRVAGEHTQRTTAHAERAGFNVRMTDLTYLLLFLLSATVYFVDCRVNYTAFDACKFIRIRLYTYPVLWVLKISCFVDMLVMSCCFFKFCKAF